MTCHRLGSNSFHLGLVSSAKPVCRPSLPIDGAIRADKASAAAKPDQAEISKRRQTQLTKQERARSTLIAPLNPYPPSRLLAPSKSSREVNSNNMATLDESIHPANVAASEFSTLLAGCTIPSSSPKATFFNWARTFKCHPQKTFIPTTIYECRLITEWARREGKTLRAAGVGHSPSDLACTDEWMIRMDGMKKVLQVSKNGPVCVTNIANPSE